MSLFLDKAFNLDTYLAGNNVFWTAAVLSGFLIAALLVEGLWKR